MSDSHPYFEPDSEESDELLPPPRDERAAVLSLLRATDVGAITVRKLIDTFGSARGAISAGDSTLREVGGLSGESVHALREAVGEGFGEEELERLERLGGRLLLPEDYEYPGLLKRVHGHPAALYVLGARLPEDEKCVAVVGSRGCTEAGAEIAHQIGAGLSLAGIWCISGMALGIDGAAHRGALQEGGRTVAVLGSGVDFVYPKKHRKLYEEIIRHGAVVSEFFLGAPSDHKNFPMRNRIISGISTGTVVVEAGERSGALITANYALQQDRLVFAVPGHPFQKMSRGCNYLLRQGVTPIRNAGDLLEDLQPVFGITQQEGAQEELGFESEPEGLSELESAVWNALDSLEPVHADRLAELLKVDSSRLTVVLMQMELRGLIRRLPGDRFLRLKGGSKRGDA